MPFLMLQTEIMRRSIILKIPPFASMANTNIASNEMNAKKVGTVARWIDAEVVPHGEGYMGGKGG